MECRLSVLLDSCVIAIAIVPDNVMFYLFALAQCDGQKDASAAVKMEDACSGGPFLPAESVLRCRRPGLDLTEILLLRRVLLRCSLAVP